MTLSIFGLQPAFYSAEIFRIQRQKVLKDYISSINPYYINKDQVFSKYRILQVIHKGYCKILHAFYKVFSKKYVENLNLYQKSLKLQINKDHLHQLTVQPKKYEKTEFNIFLQKLVSMLFPPFTHKSEGCVSYINGDTELKFESDTELLCDVKGYKCKFIIPQTLNIIIAQDENLVCFPDKQLKGEIVFNGIHLPIVLNHVSLNATHICVDIELYNLSWLAKNLLSALGKGTSTCVKTRKEKLLQLFTNINHKKVVQ